MINIGIHTEAQDSGKSYLAINLALSLSQMGNSVVLVDADDANNGADTSFDILSRRPLRNRGFKYCDLSSWTDSFARHDKQPDYAIFDTSRKPTNGIKSALKEDCNIVLIPCAVNDKSMQAAQDALEAMRDADVLCAIVPNRKGNADTGLIKTQFKRTRAFITSDLPDDQLSGLMKTGDLLVDAPANDESVAELGLVRMEKLTREILALVQ